MPFLKSVQVTVLIGSFVLLDHNRFKPVNMMVPQILPSVIRLDHTTTGQSLSIRVSTGFWEFFAPLEMWVFGQKKNETRGRLLTFEAEIRRICHRQNNRDDRQATGQTVESG